MIEFKKIPFSDNHEISKLGTVRNTKNGNSTSGSDSHGYKVVTIKINGKQVLRSVHSLVMLTFEGERPIDENGKKYFIFHKNKIKSDNRFENLEYITQIESRNRSHFIYGEKNPMSVLTAEKVRIIKKLPKWMTHKKIADAVGVSRPTVTNILNGKRWKHIS